MMVFHVKMFGLRMWVKMLWEYMIGADSVTEVNKRCLPMSASVMEMLQCFIENAWICFSLRRDVAHECTSAIHFLIRFSVCMFGVLEGWILFEVGVYFESFHLI